MGRRAVLEAIGANLKRLRSERRISQEALAEGAGVDIRTIQRIEAAETNPTIGLLFDIAEVLDEDLETLFNPMEIKRAKRGRPKRA